MLLCRSTNMAFGHQVQLWRYMSCALICAVNGTCGAKYREVEFAENMINLHHLMTPQEAQVLEVWRPGTSYASKEFCVHVSAERRAGEAGGSLYFDCFCSHRCPPFVHTCVWGGRVTAFRLILFTLMCGAFRLILFTPLPPFVHTCVWD